ncbi:MAG: pitrilysin family protein [archaeon]
MRTKIVRKKLSNGLRVLLLKNKSNDIAVMISFKVGLVNETKENNGVSHFVEHMLWQGNYNRTAEKIRKEFDAIHGAFNAFTESGVTKYCMMCPKRHFAKALEIFAEVIQKPVFNEEEIEKEKKVILNEMSQSNDVVPTELSKMMDNSIYGSHPFSLDVIGTKETVGKMNKQMLEEHYNKFYVPNNAILAINGDVKNALPLVKKCFKFKPKKIPKSVSFNPNTFKGPQIVKQEKPINTSYIGLCYVTPGWQNKSVYALEIIEDILEHSQELSLLEEIRNKKGLTYSLDTSISLTKNHGGIGVTLSTDKKEVPNVIQIIQDKIIKMEHITEKELTKSKKRLIKQRKNILKSKNEIVTLTNLAITCESNKTWDKFYNKTKKIEQVTTKDIEYAVRNYLNQNYVLATIEQTEVVQ